jgi:aspartyl protease family protein
MFRSALVLLFVAVGIGAMMPTRPSAPTAGPRAATLPLIDEADEPSAAQTSIGSEVQLRRDENGHFYAEVDVNGTNLLFMVDTGATGIALTEEDARRAGVTLDGPRTYVGEGAGGALTGLPVRLGTVRLGDKSASMVEAVVIDGSSTNLLGQSFLSRFAEVTVRDDVMTLR